MTIVDNYFPFDTGPGSSATAARWRLMARLFNGSGVIYNFLNALAPSIAGSVVTVQPGAVWIDGYYGEIDSPKGVGVTGNGMVVARMDPTARQVVLMFVANQTVPTQNKSGIYEVPIMQVTGATGRDIRQFARPNSAPSFQARVYRQGVWNSATTAYIFGFDTISYGTGMTGATGVITCPVDGWYLVTAQAAFVASAVGQWYNIWLGHATPAGNVNVAFSNNHSASVGQYLTVRATDIVACNVNDQLFMSHQASVNGCQGLTGSLFCYMTIRCLP